MNHLKRKRTEVSLDQKREITQYKDLNPKIPNLDLMRHFNEKWNINLSLTTICDMLKNRDKYFDSDNLKPSDTKRLRLCENPDLEKALYLWLSSVTAHNISVSDVIFA